MSDFKKFLIDAAAGARRDVDDEIRERSVPKFLSIGPAQHSFDGGQTWQESWNDDTRFRIKLLVDCPDCNGEGSRGAEDACERCGGTGELEVQSCRDVNDGN